MPFSLSYPGVHIEEVPSGVRTITGVGFAPLKPAEFVTLRIRQIAGQAQT